MRLTDLAGHRENLVVRDPGVLEQMLLVRGDHGILPALTSERPDRLDILPNRNVRDSPEDGSWDLPTCCATSPACRDTKTRMITALSSLTRAHSKTMPATRALSLEREDGESVLQGQPTTMRASPARNDDMTALG